MPAAPGLCSQRGPIAPRPAEAEPEPEAGASLLLQYQDQLNRYWSTNSGLAISDPFITARRRIFVDRHMNAYLKHQNENAAFWYSPSTAQRLHFNDYLLASKAYAVDKLRSSRIAVVAISLATTFLSPRKAAFRA
jgi:hypothetical protein